MIFSEVQLEPWTITGFLKDLNQVEQEAMFGPVKIRQTLAFAKSTGFNEFYLWGAEWWYWQKLYGNRAIWETVKELWLNN